METQIPEGQELEQEATQAKDAKPLPWYTLNPAALGRFRLVRAFFIGLIIVSISIVPVWRLFWYIPIYASGNFRPVPDTHGRLRAAWRWVESREVRVYRMPDTKADAADIIAAGAQELADDAGLNFTVKAMPLPNEIREAYKASTVEKTVNGEQKTCIDFSRLESRLIELREGDPHADMLVVTTPIAECWWAHGMATSTSGVAVLENDFVNHHLGKHETGHLLGYLYHDSLPLYVIGYPWEGFPWSRDTLMVLYGESTTLSPRTRDALRYFWKGMEQRTGRDYIKD